MKGTIKNILNGFGFIQPEDGGKDVFFHANDVNGTFDSLMPNMTVSFDMGESDKGPKAENVTPE